MTRVEAEWAYSVTYYDCVEWTGSGGQAGKTLACTSGLHINDLAGYSLPLSIAIGEILLVIESYIDLTLCHGYIGKDTSS